jgi:hypothetical protein
MATFNPLAGFTSGGQNEDRRGGGFGGILERLADREPIHMAKQYVQDDEIGAVLSSHSKPRKSVSGDENAESRFAQVIPKQIHHIGFVFDTVSCMHPSQ